MYCSIWMIGASPRQIPVHIFMSLTNKYPCILASSLPWDVIPHMWYGSIPVVAWKWHGSGDSTNQAHRNMNSPCCGIAFFYIFFLPLHKVVGKFHGAARSCCLITRKESAFVFSMFPIFSITTATSILLPHHQYGFIALLWTLRLTVTLASHQRWVLVFTDAVLIWVLITVFFSACRYCPVSRGPR